MTMKPDSQKPVWAHSSGKGQDVRDRIVAFCAGRDVAAIPPCDEALILEDLATNEAALLALHDAKILARREASTLAAALLDLRALAGEGRFALDPELEDVHINIERALGERVGEIAGKLHSGRSRNDQVACDLRLWHRGRILSHLEGMIETLHLWLEQAEAGKGTLLPGFTHHQRAFITTWGHTLASYVQAQLRDVERGWGVFERTNRSPIGAAAGYGTSWPLDRVRMAEHLGFDSVLENSADAVSSRIEVETDLAAWLALWMTHCSMTAQDLILFSMEEFRWILLAPEATTGSSIMPQKRNPDFAEVIKGKTALVHGALAALLSMAKGQPSGYHRDSQYSKPVGQDLWREVSPIPGVLRDVFVTLRLDRKRMREATSGGFLEAAEWADAVAQDSGLPFREVYACIGRAVDECRKSGRLTRDSVNRAFAEQGIAYRASAALAKSLGSPETLLERRKSLGSPNPDRVLRQVESLCAELDAWEAKVNRKSSSLEKSEKKRLDDIRRLAESAGKGK